MLNKKERGNYITIFSDGSLRKKVDKNTEGAVFREYELKDGTKGEKYELVYDSLTGHLTNAEFFDGDFGQQLVLTFEDETQVLKVSVHTDSNFATDIMKKLPNINLAEPITFDPYGFEDDSGRLRKGVTIYQNNEKVKNYYFDETTKKSTNGFPEPTGDTSEYSKDDWKVYFIGVKKFLIAATQKIQFPNVDSKTPTTLKNNKDEVEQMFDEEEINPDDIPFNSDQQ